MYTVFHGAEMWQVKTMKQAYKKANQLNRMIKGNRYGMVQNSIGVEKRGKIIYCFRACGDEIIARWNW